MRATKESIPAELRHKISPAMLIFSGSGFFLKVMGIGGAAFLLCVAAGGNGLLYLLGAALCPSAVVVLYKLVPLRPYRGVFYDRSMHDIDSNDPAVMRLVQLFRSSEARRQLWQQAVKLSGILFVIAWGATLLLGGGVSWSVPISWSRFWGMTLLNFGIVLGIMGGDYSEWGVRTWARRETGQHDPHLHSESSKRNEN